MSGQTSAPLGRTRRARARAQIAKLVEQLAAELDAEKLQITAFEPYHRGVEFSQFDRHPAYASGDRRTGADRRGGVRRERDRSERMRELAAFAIAMCGGLAVLFLFFVIIGTVEIGDAVAATVAAIVLALIWLWGFRHRMKTGAAMVQRPDRERRGF